jgi:UTP--glucose-1-phosphate uridylyltransferase
LNSEVVAVIAAAGNGIRRRPITSVIPKSLLPILNRPLLDYAIEECLKSVTNEINVVYSDDLVAHYLAINRAARADMRTVKLIRQVPEHGYGSGVPAMLTSALVGQRLMYYVAVDDVVICDQRDSILLDLIEAKRRTGAAAVVAARFVDAKLAHRYGVLGVRVDGTGEAWLTGIAEKPQELTPGGYLVYLGRFIADSTILDVVRRLRPAVDGELRITDAISAYARQNKVLVLPASYAYFDCGSVDGWLAANIAASRIARHNEEG